MPIENWSTATSPRRSVSACDMIPTLMGERRSTGTVPTLGSASSIAQVRSSTASLPTQLPMIQAFAGAQPPGWIARRAAVVIFGEAAQALVAEHHVVGGED